MQQLNIDNTSGRRNAKYVFWTILAIGAVAVPIQFKQQAVSFFEIVFPLAQSLMIVNALPIIAPVIFFAVRDGIKPKNVIGSVVATLALMLGVWKINSIINSFNPRDEKNTNDMWQENKVDLPSEVFFRYFKKINLHDSLRLSSFSKTPIYNFLQLDQLKLIKFYDYLLPLAMTGVVSLTRRFFKSEEASTRDVGCNTDSPAKQATAPTHAHALGSGRGPGSPGDQGGYGDDQYYHSAATGGTSPVKDSDSGAGTALMRGRASAAPSRGGRGSSVAAPAAASFAEQAVAPAQAISRGGRGSSAAAPAPAPSRKGRDSSAAAPEASSAAASAVPAPIHRTRSSAAAEAAAPLYKSPVLEKRRSLGGTESLISLARPAAGLPTHDHAIRGPSAPVTAKKPGRGRG